ncbi:MAG: hypothetical protein JNL97_03295 [Verrucomicrobiales bacterium]|nr:hypothetical protein [Verrucomicrobiales bacterium]
MISRPLALLAFGFAVAASLAAPPPDLRLRVGMEGGRPRLEWPSEARHRYDVEFATSAVGPWSVRTQVNPDAATANWTDTNAAPGVGARFYRVADRGVSDPGGWTASLAFRAVEGLPLELSDYFARSSRDAGDAVRAATILSGSSQAVTTGTLTLTGDAANPVRYAPTPQDRLVLVPTTGPSTEVWVTTLDLVRGIYEWRQVSGGADLTFRSEPGVQASIVTARGTYRSETYGASAFAVDLRAAISGFDEVDSSGSHTLSDVTVTGTIDVTGYSQQVNARNRFEFVSSRNSVGRLQSASTGEVWSRHRLVFAGATYEWIDVKRQRSFRDGKESEVDTYWNATGTITRNGAPYGTLRKILAPVGGSVLDLRFRWEFPDGFVDVEQWTIQVPGTAP